jgi:predicted nucleotidyltransferase
VSYQDFAEFIRILNRHRVRFVVIGGYAIAFHGAPRATDDIDVLVEQTESNIRRLERALIEFAGSAPRPEALRQRRGVVRIGGPVVHIDVTTKIDGIATFGPVWERRVRGDFLGVPTSFLSMVDLLRTKRAANRPKDQGDIAFLRAALAARRRKK